MRKKLTIPNTAEYVVAIASATERADTLTFLLETGAIAIKETGQMRQIRQALDVAYVRMCDVPRERMDWDVYATLGEILVALESPDSQAYLAFRLRDARSGDDLIDALAVVYGAHRYRQRPWEADADEYAAAALRRMLSSLTIPLRSETAWLDTSITPLLETAGGAR